MLRYSAFYDFTAEEVSRAYVPMGLVNLFMYILSYLPILITVAVIMNLIDHPGNSFHSDAQKQQ
jgi:hypothetical protein